MKNILEKEFNHSCNVIARLISGIFDCYLEHVMKELYVPEDHFTIKGQIKNKLKEKFQRYL